MPDPGELLANRYRLDEQLGGGGMGEVWRATDEKLGGRTVAVKLMRPDLLAEPGFVERFQAEARAMAKVRHPGVVAIYDYHGDGQVAFMVMEYVAGEPLSAILRRTPRLAPDRTMGLVAQAADGLQAIHDRGLIHRNVKPRNLLVTAGDRVVLADSGVLQSANDSTGAVSGTPTYVAPEQVLGKPATPLSDVYALGVVAYVCLAGTHPFAGDNPFEAAMKPL